MFSQTESCTIPPRNVYNGLIKDVNGVILSEDTQVRSGDSVEYVCPPGSTPDHLELTCNAQRWDTETGTLPVCQEGRYQKKRNVISTRCHSLKYPFEAV